MGPFPSLQSAKTAIITNSPLARWPWKSKGVWHLPLSWHCPSFSCEPEPAVALLCPGWEHGVCVCGYSRHAWGACQKSCIFYSWFFHRKLKKGPFLLGLMACELEFFGPSVLTFISSAFLGCRNESHVWGLFCRLFEDKD